MTDADRRARLLDIWLQRPPEEQTDNGILLFYKYIEDNHPELLVRGKGDPYQHLRVDLIGHGV